MKLCIVAEKFILSRKMSLSESFC